MGGHAMRRLLTVVLTIGFTAFASVPTVRVAAASTGLPVLARDSVTGTGNTGDLFIAIVADATSDASGGSPTGTIAFDVLGAIHTEGPITCLQVRDNEAVIGFD